MEGGEFSGWFAWVVSIGLARVDCRRDTKYSG